ncbi:MAG: hypothetical protein KC613_26590, partial [Myxococcales bacterium]|nr:hypothetical protein [Myxococcales bacterium]
MDATTTATTTPIEAPRAPTPSGGWAAIDGLLRDRPALLARIERGEDLLGLVRSLALTLAATTAVVGATIGAFRGGAQIAFAAVKLPLVVGLTAALCTPAYSALTAAIRGRTDLRKDVAVVLASLALSGLLLSALAPVILLGVFVQLSYHKLALLFTGACFLAGAGGLSLFVQAERRRAGAGSKTVLLVLLATFAAVGSQVAWTLRPYLVRPRAPEVPFVRAVEGSLAEAVLYSSRSALGLYRRGRAPLPGEPGAGRFKPVAEPE